MENALNQYAGWLLSMPMIRLMNRIPLPLLMEALGVLVPMEDPLGTLGRMTRVAVRRITVDALKGLNFDSADRTGESMP